MSDRRNDNPAGEPVLKFAIPKGRMHDGVVRLLGDAGHGVSSGARDYRPRMAGTGFDVKVLKPRAIIEMLSDGARDMGFAGADWVEETGAELVELLDTGLDRVRLVAAAPESVLEDGRLPERPLVVASEYVELARTWVRRRGIDARLLRSYGATEVLPPEDADCIVDNTATGATLTANNLRIIDDLTVSSTRLYASPAAMEDGGKRAVIERFVLVVRSVLEARARVMIEVNVSADRLGEVVEVLPCMREPTVSPLHSASGYAVKAAVRRDELPRAIPLIKQAGGTDLVVTKPEQIVP